MTDESVRIFYKFAILLNIGYACGNSKSIKGFCKMLQRSL